MNTAAAKGLICAQLTSVFFGCLAAFQAIGTRIMIDQLSETITIRRTLGASHWTARFGLNSAERFFESGVDRGKRLNRRLTIEMGDGRRLCATLRSAHTSLAPDNLRLNKYLWRLQRESARQAHRSFRVRTAKEKQQREVLTAVVEVRTQLRRFTYVLGAFVVSACATVPFYVGMPLNAYWRNIGNPILFLCLLLFIALTVQTVLLYVRWDCKKSMQSIYSKQGSTGL
jgi:hypothetical protein